MSRSNRMLASVCPHCSAHLDAASAVDVDDAQPAPGDVSVCFYCGGILQFDDDLRVVKPADLRAVLAEHPWIIGLQNKVRGRIE